MKIRFQTKNKILLLFSLSFSSTFSGTNTRLFWYVFLLANFLSEGKWIIPTTTTDAIKTSLFYQCQLIKDKKVLKYLMCFYFYNTQFSTFSFTGSYVKRYVKLHADVKGSFTSPPDMHNWLQFSFQDLIVIIKKRKTILQYRNFPAQRKCIKKHLFSCLELKRFFHLIYVSQQVTEEK